ncbi:MAG: LytR/AlgR family response regulator transcription factor [Bacteroidota bacterium]
MKANVIRTLIVDDEPLARKGIRDLLKGSPDVTIVGEAENGLEAVQMIATHAPALVFLDVQMPGLDGFGVIAQVGVERMPLTVFVTAYNLHALQAFKVHAVDYLLKPVQPEHFAAALDRARKLLLSKNLGDVIDRLRLMMQEVKSERQYLQRLAIKGAGKIDVVRMEEIDWLAADGDYVHVHAGEKKYLHREMIGTLEQELDPAQFVRIHRSTIVRMDRIKQLEPHFNGDFTVILHSGHKLSLSRSYRQKVMETLQRSGNPAAP